MKRPESSDGFLMCFLLNMLWELGWGIATVILLILSFQTGLPHTWWRLALAAWLLVAFIKTGLIEWGSKVSAMRDPEKPNKNPYSVGGPEGPSAEEIEHFPRQPQSDPLTQVEPAEPDEVPNLVLTTDVPAAPAAPAVSEVDTDRIEAALDDLKRSMDEEEGPLTLQQGG